jgi:hypothetical protein
MGFRFVLFKETEERFGLISIESLGELMEEGRDLKSGEKDSLLSLEEDVFWPSQKSGDVSLGLGVVTDSEVSGSFFEKRILFSVKSLFSGTGFFGGSSFGHFSI